MAASGLVGNTSSSISHMNMGTSPGPGSVHNGTSDDAGKSMHTSTNTMDRLGTHISTGLGTGTGTDIMLNRRSSPGSSMAVGVCTSTSMGSVGSFADLHPGHNPLYPPLAVSAGVPWAPGLPTNPLFTLPSAPDSPRTRKRKLADASIAPDTVDLLLKAATANSCI